MRTLRPIVTSWGSRIALFVVLSLGLILGGYRYYMRQVTNLRNEKYQELATIGQLKLDRLAAWRAERLGDVRSASSGLVRAELLRFIAKPMDVALKRSIVEHFGVLASNFGYQNVALVAPNGRVLLSLDGRLTEIDLVAAKLVGEVLASGRPVFGDLYRCSLCHDVHLDVAAPILDDLQQAKGIVILRSDPERVIYPLLRFWPTASRSAESLLVRREANDVLFLNGLRHRRDAVLTLRDALTHVERPAVQAVLGKTGLTTGIDYRGIEVIGSLHRIPDSPWFLVAKVDAQELLSEARYRSWVILGFVIMGIGMTGLTLGLLFHVGQGRLHRELLGFAQLSGRPVDNVPEERQRRARRFTTAAGIVAVAVGAIALLGWQFEVAALKSVLPGFVAMKANTALGLVLSGLSLTRFGEDQSTSSITFSRALASATLLLGFATLCQFLLGVDLGIDEFLYREGEGTIGTLSPGRMAPATAFNFVILGIALQLGQGSRQVRVSQWLAVIIGFLGLLPLVGYVCGAKSLYGLGGLTQLAIHTAVAFVVLSLGIAMAHPTEGMMRTAMASMPGGWLLRRMIPLAIVIPPALGWLRLLGERHGAFEGSLGVALLIMAIIVVLVVTFWWAAVSLNQLDAIRAHAEHELHDNAEEIRATLYGIGDGVVTTDAAGHVKRMNPVAEHLTGWTELEAAGRPLPEVFRIVNEETKQAVESPVGQVLRDGQVVGLANHTALISRAGKMRPIADSGAPIRGADGQVRGVVLVFRDQTSERASQSAVRQAEGNFVASFHGSPVAMTVTLVSNGEHVDVNDVFLRDFGFLRDDVLGSSDEDLQLFVEPTERERLFEIIEKDGHAYNLEATLRTKSGQKRTCLISTGMIQIGGRRHLLSSILDISARKRAEEDLRTALLEAQQLLQMADESRRALLSMLEDQATDERRRKELEEQLSQAQKMESIGRLAGGVAHDFNNLISVILNYTAFAAEDMRNGKSASDDLAEVQKAGNRAAALTHQLLAFSRKQVLQPVPLSLNYIIRGVEAMLRRLLREDIEFVQVLASDLGLTCADPNQMEQVLMNLVVNAGDAMPNGGRITIATLNVEIDAECMERHVDVSPGPYVQMSITDNGCGMDETVKAQIFEPFFTTKEPGKGTGLGLATVYGIIKQSGGSIWVYSELGRGTTFKIYLPRIADSETVRLRTASVVRQVSGSETILVVEDEPALRAVARRALVAAGFAVLVAANGEEALALAQAFAGEIHMLLTDVVMPKMNGRALADELNKLRPAMAVLYMSGYTDDAIVHHGVLDASTNFIGKPFAAVDLTRKVRDVLDHQVELRTLGTRHIGRSPSEFKSEVTIAQAVSAIPDAIAGDLRRALTAARYDEIVELLGRLQQVEPAAAAAIDERIVSFDYEGILTELEQRVGLG